MLVLIPITAMFLHIFALRGRRNHPGMIAFRHWRYAHRGLHNAQRPENSMAAFRAALENGYGIEFDLHLLKDGNLAVIHDSDLMRTTGQPGRIEDLTTQQLKDYPLQGTNETIPQFRQVLELFNGKAPLIIELKSAEGNYARLTETACRMMEGYDGPWCMESFDPWCVYWLRKNRPDIVRGQLSENFLHTAGKYPWILRFVTTYYLENFLVRPDFIAYKYADRKTASNRICRHFWGLQGVSWTIRSPEELREAEQEGWLPIFEGFDPGPVR